MADFLEHIESSNVAKRLFSSIASPGKTQVLKRSILLMSPVKTFLSEYYFLP